MAEKPGDLTREIEADCDRCVALTTELVAGATITGNFQNKS
jgi:hypothetical protein